MLWLLRLILMVISSLMMLLQLMLMLVDWLVVDCCLQIAPCNRMALAALPAGGAPGGHPLEAALMGHSGDPIADLLDSSTDSLAPRMSSVPAEWLHDAELLLVGVEGDAHTTIVSNLPLPVVPFPWWRAAQRNIISPTAMVVRWLPYLRWAKPV